MEKVLIVDDKSDIRELLSDILSDEGYSTIEASNAKAALNSMDSERPNLVILDIWLEGSEFDGVGVLKRIKSKYPEVPVIMISGHGNIETAIQTIKLGAFDFIEKPFKAEKLLLITKRALQVANLELENSELKKDTTNSYEIIGGSKLIQQLKDSINTVASSQSRVLLKGEIGVGKEVIARAIHYASPRKAKRFCILHSCTLTPSNFQEELFGIDDGENYKIGLLEKANGGTLFIDELSEMPETAQSSLLKTLLENNFTKIGSNKTTQLDIRIISSSSKNLEQEAINGTLNKSLLYRLNVIPLEIPPLRIRKEDIKLLSNFFIKTFSESMGVPKLKISKEALSIMEMYNWPGNIRQLKNLVEWLIMMHGKESKEIQIADLPDEISGKTNTKDAANQNNSVQELITKPIKEARDNFEKIYLSAQLSRFSGNIAKTAEHIGMERTALYRKLKSLEIA